MPTNKKRVGFIPREDVMELIDKLSFENNLSNSKIVGFLVEEALTYRGLYNTKTGIERSHSDQNIINKKALHDKLNMKNDFLENEVSDIHYSSNISKDQSNNFNFDIQLYKKFLSFLKFQEMLKKYED